jgi:hypothetical protein
VDASGAVLLYRESAFLLGMIKKIKKQIKLKNLEKK